MAKLSTMSKIRIGHRRSKRLGLRVPVLVYGRGRDKSPFHEKTEMISVNAHGGLVELRARVEQGHTILVVNEATGKEQECLIVDVGREVNGRTRVGIAFLHPAPTFWQVHFPTADRKSPGY